MLVLTEKSLLTEWIGGYLEELGALPANGTNPRNFGYAYTLDTALGPLHIQHYDFWIACRFEEPKRALEGFGNRVGLFTPNAYTGKWNLHWSRGECLRMVQEQIRRHFASIERINYMRGFKGVTCESMDETLSD